MFKTLFATSLLIIGKFNLTTFNKPKQNAVNFTSLYGTYVLRDDFHDRLQSFADSHTTGWHSLDFSGEDYYHKIYCLVSSSSGNLDIGYLDSLHLGIGVYSNAIEVDFIYNSNFASTIYNEIDLEEETWTEVDTLNKLINKVSLAIDKNALKYNTLYFNGDINLQGESAEIFDVFYTKDGNQYNTYYNGYYHFVNTISSSGFYRCQCQIIIDNILYNFFNIDTSSVSSMNGTYTDGGIQYNDTYILWDSTHGYYLNNMNVYINGILPQPMYNVLNHSGTFSYVQPQAPSDFSFQDFFFGIADTPLYYAWSLLNWDLFGLNLFVAFCGLCTLALIVFVIKKLI